MLPAGPAPTRRRYRGTVTERPRRRRLGPIVGLVALLVVIWAVVAAMQVAAVVSEVTDGVAHADTAQAGTRNLTSLVGAVGREQGPDPSRDRQDREDAGTDVVAELDAAVTSFEAALEGARSPVLAPVRVLPVLGRQLRTSTTLLDSAVQVGSDTSDALEELRTIAGDRASTPEERVQAVRRGQEVLDELAPRLEDPDLGTDRGLIDSVRDARTRFAELVDQTRGTLRSASIGLNGVGDLLEGPSTYLVLAANNAEMRAGSGMFLQVGTLEITDGRFELSDFVPVQELFLEQPGASLDPDVAARWGALVPNQEWRNLNLTPRFDESARMASEMWAAAGRGQVDGVIAIDVVAVQRLLELTGPVDVPGPDGVTTFDADNVRNRLLRSQYQDFDDREERRDLLGQVGASVFQAFNERPIPAADLVGLIDQSGAERHLLLWSSDPDQQAAWSELRVSGVLPPDALMVSLLNRSGTKLDPYLEVRSTLASEDLGDRRRVTVTVDVDNTAPDGLPRYVQGPYPGFDAVAGEYVGILALSVPAAADAAESSVEGFAVIGSDGPTQVVGVNLSVERGRSERVTFSFDLPADSDRLRVVSGARVPATRWTAGDKKWVERRPRTVVLSSLE